MKEFKYTAHDIYGVEKQGIIKADDQNRALLEVRRKGLFPLEVVGITLALPSRKKVRSPGFGLNMEIRLPAVLARVHPKELMLITRQMATLIQAGLPLLRGLTILERQEKNPAMKKAMGQISAAIESGSTFADALALCPRIFSRFFINMVKAGETGGILDGVLERMAAYMEKTHRIKNKVKTAMAYPLVILLVSCAILIFLMTSIIPQFETIFSDLLEGRTLPPLTLLIMNLSEWIQENAAAILLCIPGLIIGQGLLKRFYYGRVLLDAGKLSAPLFGNLIRTGLLARFARTLGTLMESGVPILQSLYIVKETLNNEIVSKAVEEIHNQVKEGCPMTTAVESHRLFPPVFGGMVEVGEETGRLPAMLLKIADLFEEEVEHTVEALSSIIEPVLIVILSAVVGTIVIALFLPLVSIMGNLN